MSSIYMREQVRAWMSTGEMLLPFFDTINRVQHVAPSRWATLSFVTAQTETASFCGGITERGLFDHIALGPPGEGDVDLFKAAWHDVELLVAQIDPRARLTLLRAGAPNDFLQGGSTPYYTVSTPVEYTLRQPLYAELLP